MSHTHDPRKTQEEHARLAALQRYAILDTPREAAFDRLTELAAHLFDTPMALVTFIDQDRQWFKAYLGTECRETDRSSSFCTYTLHSDAVLVIPDTTQDERFQHNALVVGSPHIRFYAGAPLVTAQGHRLGSICVLDTVPREPLTAVEQQALQHLAASVMSELDLRLALLNCRRIEAIHQQMMSASRDAVLILDAQGIIIEWNPGAEQMFGHPREEVVGQNCLELIETYLGLEPRRQFWAFLQLQTIQQRGRTSLDVIQDRHGQSLPVETTILPLDVDGARLYALIIRDRTQQEAAKQELVTQRNLLQAAMDGVPETMYVKDLDGRYQMINAKGAALLGRPIGAILGHTDDEIWPPQTASAIRARDQQVVQTQQQLAYDLGEVSVFNNRRIFHTIKSVYRDATGQVAGLTTVVLDVTEQRASEETIRDHNVRLSQQVQEAQLEILERLARAAEYRDDDTGEHMHRVGRTAAGLAQALGLPDDEISLIRQTAPLHDVGKIGISDRILLKPSRLTPEEFEIVQTHTQIGAEILRGGCSPLVQMAETIARTHHERWDGTGYPAGLAGNTIPLVGRIVAVADVFDALISERPYKKAWTIEAARTEIRAQSGRQFDPEVVMAFEHWFEQAKS